MSTTVECWLYSEGDATRSTDSRITAGGVAYYLAAPTRFRAAMAAWGGMQGAGYTLSYSATTRRVTISHAAAHTLDMSAGTARLLGFTGAPYGAATSHTGEVVPAGIAECVAIDVYPREDGARIDLRSYRHARSLATTSGNAQVFSCEIVLRESDLGLVIPDGSFAAGYLLAGKLRIERGDAAAYTASNPDGYLDGHVVAIESITQSRATGEFIILRILLAVDTTSTAPAAAAGTLLFDTVRYGWQVIWAVMIEGIPTIFTEHATGFALPSGWTAEVAALVLDDSAVLGSQVDRARGLGVGLAANFKLLSSASVDAYMRAPPLGTILDAAVTAAEVGAISVVDTTGWPAAGDLYVGLERVGYTGQTAPPGATFTGLTRGKGGVAYAHRVGSVSSQVTSLPYWWIGRDVQIWAIPCDPGGLPSSADGALLTDAEMVWRGRIDGGPTRASDGWDFSAISLDRILDRELLARLSGKIVDAVPRYTIEPIDTWPCYIDVEQGGAIVASALLLIKPWGALTAGVCYSAAELRAAFVIAWAAAVTAAGAGAWLGAIKSAWAYWKIALIGNAAWVGSAKIRISWKLDQQSNIWWPDATAAGEALVKIASQGMDAGVYEIKSVDEMYALTVAVEISDGSVADLSAPGLIVVEGGIYRFWDLATSGSTAYLGHVTTLGNNWLDKAQREAINKPGLSVEIRYEASAQSLGLLAAELIESSGTAALRGTYDVLGRGQGYGIPDDCVDEASLLGVPAALVGLGVTADVAATSCADLACSGLALARAAIVARRQPASALDPRYVRLRLVPTDTTASDYLLSISTADLLGIDSDALTLEERLEVPTVLKVERTAAGSDTPDKILATDLAAADVLGSIEQAHTVPATSIDALRVLVQDAAALLFASERFTAAIKIRVGPWVDAHVGDAVHLDLMHPLLWDYLLGTPGYVGNGRVVGRTLHPRTLVCELTIIIGGALRGSCLSIASEVSASAAGTVDVPLTHLAHWSQALALAGGQVKALHYRPGAAENSAANWTHVTLAVAVAGICRLSVADWAGEAVSVALATTLTLPLSADGEITEYQQGFAHDSDGTRWI